MVRRTNSIFRFFAAPTRSKLLALEALCELTLARARTLLSARYFTRKMGELEGTPIQANPRQQDHAARIGHVVALTAQFVPFRAVCLQQVLAVRRMLKRRHIPATVFLGVQRSASVDLDRHVSAGTAAEDMAAHAWVKSGDRVVNGKTPDLDSYIVLGMFS